MGERVNGAQEHRGQETGGHETGGLENGERLNDACVTYEQVNEGHGHETGDQAIDSIENGGRGNDVIFTLLTPLWQTEEFQECRYTNHICDKENGAQEHRGQ
nr:hypothetical protein BaRGS_014065 [Batillaria attramentaria]